MNATWRRFLLIPLALAANTCVYAAMSHPALGGARLREAQADDVREAVFRWQIADHRKHGETCFLTIRGRSQAATAAFVASRFKHSPYVKPLSDPVMESAHTPMLMHTATVGGYVDAQTGKPAFRFWTDALGWKSDGEAEVNGGGANSMHGGDFGTFSVVWKAHRWKVSGYKVRGVY